jgi:nucleoside-diphosphate-sugar epimerase
LRVLVTGGNGLLGTYIARELASSGHEVTSFGRHTSSLPGTESVIGDVTDLRMLREAAANHDALVHLAAVTGPGKTTAEELMHTNVIGTVNVLESAIGVGIRKVVFASSGAATGFSFQRHEIVPAYLPIDEDHPAAPQDEYGLSKLLCEVACKRYSAAFGISTICLRINNAWYIDRDSASIALGSAAAGSSWTKGLTIEDVWRMRYLKMLSAPDGPWPQPGPPPPRHLLWAVSDARDVAVAFRLAVEATSLGHEVFAINADDTCSLTPSVELVRRHFPDVVLRSPLNGFATLVSVEKSGRMLGYKPRFSWRNSDFQVWLNDQGLLRQPGGSSPPTMSVDC